MQFSTIALGGVALIRKAWIDARHDSINQRLWGLTLLERNLRELEILGITEAVVLTREDLQPQNHFRYPNFKSLKIAYRFGDSTDPFLSLRSELENENPILALEGHSVNDRRVLKKMLDCKSSCGVRSPVGKDPATMAVISLGDSVLFEKNESRPLTRMLDASLKNARIPALDLSNFNRHIIQLRRELDPFLLLIEDSKQLEEADYFLRMSAHKGVNDFVAKFIHPPLEFAGTKLLLNTPIAPNQITIFWVLLAAITLPLFVTGHLLFGILLAAIRGVLDGIDGKLARLTLRFSKAGDRLDHVTDTIYEAAWCLAIGWYFMQGDLQSTAATFTAIFFVSYLVERIVPGVFKKIHGREIYDYTEIDKFLRVIGSRANNNIWVLMIGIILGFARETYYAVSLWMLATASWHTLRLIWVTWKTNIRRSTVISNSKNQVTKTKSQINPSFQISNKMEL